MNEPLSKVKLMS